jgi:catechol 2,3-dioxygenase-like lactoylglutathione lyase family enzyme
MDISAIDHVAFAVADLEASMAFYVRVFGAFPAGPPSPEGIRR